MSVGDKGGERQVTNVAAGTENTDAVNKGQLDAVAGSVSDASHYFKANGNGDGTDDAQASGQYATATGSGAYAGAEGATATGSGAVATGSHATASGYGAVATKGRTVRPMVPAHRRMVRGAWPSAAMRWMPRAIR